MNRFTVNHFLALTAGMLALGGLLVGDRTLRGNPGKTEEVTPVELARWIKEKKAGLRVIDLRESAEYIAYHIPTAQQFSADVITPSEKPTTLVLYSDTGNARDKDFAIALRPEGSTEQVLVLRGGVNAWLHDIMLPRMPPNPTTEQRQSYEERRELSQYFGGRASALEPDTGRTQTAAAVRKLKRMGC
jgi:rhodanese-related sulfurtransferase